jgi:NAD+ diphosphatase
MLTPEQFPGRPRYFPIQAGCPLLVPEGVELRFPDEAPPGVQHVLGSVDDRPCLAVDVDGDTPPAPLVAVDLRELYGQVTELDWSLASRAVQVVGWDRTHRYCGRCGTLTEARADERLRVCPNCGLSAYPRISPAIISLVTRGEQDEEALLAWGRRSPKRRFSTLAGFVEIGETLEDAVHREIREETGVEVKDISYFGSQPWPFPSQLMVGFRARYAGGEIRAQDSEIVEARWFTPAEVQEVVHPHGSFTIAGWLIDSWLAEQGFRRQDTPVDKVRTV